MISAYGLVLLNMDADQQKHMNQFGRTHGPSGDISVCHKQNWEMADDIETGRIYMSRYL